MLSEASTKALHDIAYHIDLAEEFARGLDRAAFSSDLKTVYAVTRCLEIISEASRRLESQIKARHATIAWGAMAAAGNIYRHDYEDVSAGRVWGVLKTDLAPLRIAVDAELASER
jgi:uncharacterized protein with HEPN domain